MKTPGLILECKNNWIFEQKNDNGSGGKFIVQGPYSFYLEFSYSNKADRAEELLCALDVFRSELENAINED